MVLGCTLNLAFHYQFLSFSQDSDTALHLAAAKGDGTVVAALLEAGADLTATAEVSVELTHSAVWCGV